MTTSDTSEDPPNTNVPRSEVEANSNGGLPGLIPTNQARQMTGGPRNW